MRIGVIRDQEIVNSVYRAELPMRALEAHGHTVHWADNTKHALDLELFKRCDAVFIHRQFDQYMQEAARAIRSSGAALWWDNDDDITALPRSDPMYREIGGKRGAEIFRGMTRMMALADIVTTPSFTLSSLYRDLGMPNVRVIENCIADEFIRLRRGPRRATGSVLVGWTAGYEHRIDAERLGIHAMFERLLSTYSQLRVATIGVGLGLRERYTHDKLLSLHDVGATAASFDIGIAPIADLRMNQARSNLKVKEYAALGVPWLASPIGPYAGLGEKQGGRLVADDRWFDALSELIEDDRGRAKLAKRAAKWGAKQTIGRNVGQWEAVLKEAVSIARRRRA